MIRSSIALYRHAYTGLSHATWWLAVVMLVNRAGTMVLPFMTVYLTEQKGFSITQAGWEVAFFGLGAIAGNYFGGRLTDGIGFSKVQFWSLFLNGVMFIVLGQMATFWQIGSAMFMVGVVGEAFRPANAAAIAWYSAPENRTRSYSLNRLAINLGFSIGPAIGGLLAFRYLFLVDGFTCMIAALFMRAALPPVTGQHRTDHHPGVQKKVAWKDHVYLRFTFFIFLTALCFLQMFSMLPVFYKDVMGFDKPLIGLLLGSNGLIIVVIEMVLVFKLEQRRSHLGIVSAGAALMGISYLVLNLPMRALFIAITSMIMVTFGEMLMFPFLNAFWIGRSNERNRGQYAALFNMSFACAQVLAPSFGSQVVQHFSYAVLWYTVFVISLIAGIGYLSFRKHEVERSITKETRNALQQSEVV